MEGKTKSGYCDCKIVKMVGWRISNINMMQTSNLWLIALTCIHTGRLLLKVFPQMSPSWILGVKSFVKGNVWEIYECISEALSHLGRMFGIIFRVQWGKKSPKSGQMCLTKMYLGPCKGAAGFLQGYRTWYAAPTCGTLTRPTEP